MPSLHLKYEIEQKRERKRLREQIKQISIISIIYCFGYGFMLYSFLVLVPILTKPISEGGLSYDNTDIGLITAFSTAGYAIGGIIMGFMISVNHAKIYFLFPLLISLLINTLTIPSANYRLAVMLTTRFFTIFMTSSCWTSMTMIINNWVEYKRQARAFGVLTIANELQYLVVSLNLGFLVLEFDWGWQKLFIYSSFISFIFVFFGVIFVKSKPPLYLSPHHHFHPFGVPSDHDHNNNNINNNNGDRSSDHFSPFLSKEIINKKMKKENSMMKMKK